MRISVPSTQCVVALASLFGVSADYLLDIKPSSSVSVEGLSDKEIAAVAEIIECFKEKGK